MLDAGQSVMEVFPVSGATCESEGGVASKSGMGVFPVSGATCESEGGVSS